MAKRDYYEILGIGKDSSDEEIKKAYRRLAIQYHPDRNAGNKTLEEKFKELNEAYQVLSDPQKKATYDRFGHAAMGGAGGFEGGGPFSGSFTDIFDNIFGDIFGQAGSSPSGGVDLRYTLDISFEEAAFGAEKTIKFDKEITCERCIGSGAQPGTKPKTCRTCRGTGQVRFNQGFFTLSRTCGHCGGRGHIIELKCETCRGLGKNKKAHSVAVKIPAGVDSDQRLRLRGEGEINEPGGRAGDLYVQLRVREHPVFKRENEHVILDLPITFVQATLGAELDIPTLGGSTKLEIQAGLQSGETLRLKGKGIKRLNGAGYGDQFVRVTVETPSRLNSKQRDLLKQFEEAGSQESYPGIARFFDKIKGLF